MATILVHGSLPHSTKHSPYYLFTSREKQTNWTKEDAQLDLSDENLVQEIKRLMLIANQKVMDVTSSGNNTINYNTIKSPERKR